MTNLVFTVGNALMGDDGAGPLLAELLEGAPAAGWDVIDGGATPENVMHHVRAAAPERLLLVDAAQMGLSGGEIRRIDAGAVADQFLINTHAIPLDYLIASLEEDVGEVVFVGIQPTRVAFYEDMTPAVRAGVEELHRRLTAGEDPARFMPVA